MAHIEIKFKNSAERFVFDEEALLDKGDSEATVHGHFCSIKGYLEKGIGDHTVYYVAHNALINLKDIDFIAYKE